jgi:hypothetical protein
VSRASITTTVAMVGLLLAGCGGSSSPTRHFAKTANAICAKTTQLLTRVPAIGGTLPRLALDVSDQLPIYEKQLRQLSALAAPASKASAYAKALSSARTDVRLLRQLRNAAHAGNRKKVHEIAVQGGSVYSVAGTTMRGIGLTRCASSL